MFSSIILPIIDVIGLISLLAIVLISAFRNLIDLLYEKGIPLPKFVEDIIVKRKKKEVTFILESMGIKHLPNQDQFIKFTQFLDIPEQRSGLNYKKELETIMAMSYSKGFYKIGKTYSYNFDYFIDIMGSTTNFNCADRCSRILANFIRDEMKKELGDPSTGIIFNKIVTPKSGSPTLGYMLGEILKIPCIFFRGNDNPKYQSRNNYKSFFDGTVSSDEIIILVDDSTTGGRMFKQAISKIREAKAKVNHAFVLFEPLGKNARKELSDLDVNLHSIIKMDGEEIQLIEKMSKKYK